MYNFLASPEKQIIKKSRLGALKEISKRCNKKVTDVIMLFYFNFALKVHSVFYKPSSIENYIFVFFARN